MADLNNIEASVEGIPPRGDLIHAIKDMIEEQSRAHVVCIKDPVSGKTANVIIAPNGGITPLPASVYDDYIDQPRFRRGTATLTSLTSFIAHVNRFKTSESVVFGCDDRTKPSLTCVLDYHPANRASEEGIVIAAPDFGRHRSAFAFPLSDEWKAWNEYNGKKMDMAAFAMFLEDRIGEVAYPGEVPLSDAAEVYVKRIGGKDRIATPTDLVTLSRGLKINENAAITNAVNLSSGEGEISFSTEHTGADGQPLIIPTSFQIAIPIFRNSGELDPLLARLRYRKNGGELVFWYELWRPDLAFDAAFTNDAHRVADETGLPVYLGSPEA